MTSEQLRVYLAAAMSSLTVGVLVPLLILFGVAWVIWIVISRAQRDKDFDLSNVLRDEKGKESSDRLTTLACFAVTSWVMAVVVFALPNLVVEVFAIYMTGWGGTSAAKEYFKRKWPDQSVPPS